MKRGVDSATEERVSNLKDVTIEEHRDQKLDFEVNVAIQSQERKDEAKKQLKLKLANQVGLTSFYEKLKDLQGKIEYGHDDPYLDKAKGFCKAHSVLINFLYKEAAGKNVKRNKNNDVIFSPSNQSRIKKHVQVGSDLISKYAQLVGEVSRVGRFS